MITTADRPAADQPLGDAEQPITSSKRFLTLPGTGTGNQRRMILTLLEERAYESAWLALFERHLLTHGLSKAKASTVLTFLFKQPKRDGTDPNAPSAKMCDLIGTLLAERETAYGYADDVRAALTAKTLTRDDARAIIKHLLNQPQKIDPTDPTVPDGRYALGTKDNPRRYRVNTTPQGRVYVDHIGPNEATTWVRGGERRQILEAIAADPLKAAQLYGEVTGRCWKCHRLLTREDSVTRGMGRDCAKAFGIGA